MSRLRQRAAIVAMSILQRVRILFYRLLSTNDMTGRPTLGQPMQLTGTGQIRFDPNVQIGVFPSPGFLVGYAYIEARNPEAMVAFGSGTRINNGFCCIAEHTSITIGSNCLIGANVEIFDSDFHGMRLGERSMSRPEWAAPVVVEDSVFVGSNVRILKGVRIGAGSVIANSSVVVSDIPPLVVAAGAPAKVIRSIE